METVFRWVRRWNILRRYKCSALIRDIKPPRWLIAALFVSFIDFVLLSVVALAVSGECGDIAHLKVASCQVSTPEELFRSVGYESTGKLASLYNMAQQLSNNAYQSKRFGLKPDDLDCCGSACRWEVNGMDHKPLFTVFALPNGSAWSYFLMIFQMRENGWGLAKAFPISHQIDLSDFDAMVYQNSVILSVENSKIHGSGVGGDEKMLFVFSHGILRNSVCVPDSGSRTGWGMPFDIEYQSEPIHVESIGKSCYISVKTHVRYSAMSQDDKFVFPEMELFETDVVTRYKWSNEKGLVWAPEVSDRKGKFDTAGWLHDGVDDFMCLNTDRLCRVALSGNSDKNVWLRWLLSSAECKTAEAVKTKAEITALLH